jgi:large subunit ribosomal protein L5
MNSLANFYNKTIKQELLNKFVYNNSKKVPSLKKIILNFGCKNADIKQIASGLLAFELLTNQQGKITKTKYSNILFKIRKGNPTGCKISLSKIHSFNFLLKMLIEIFPKLKSFYGFSISKKIQKNVFSYELQDIFSFSELENHYYLFNTLPKLNITIITTSNNKTEMIYLLKSFKLPLNPNQFRLC